MIRPRDIYTVYTREQVMKFLQQEQLRVVGFRPPARNDQFVSTGLCVYTAYSDSPLIPAYSRLIVEHLP